jgi:hypothetical protein
LQIVVSVAGSASDSACPASVKFLRDGDLLFDGVSGQVWDAETGELVVASPGDGRNIEESGSFGETPTILRRGLGGNIQFVRPPLLGCSQFKTERAANRGGLSSKRNSADAMNLGEVIGGANAHDREDNLHELSLDRIYQIRGRERLI